MSEPIKSKFSDWTQQQLELTFGLAMEPELPSLKSWLTDGKNVQASESEKVTLGPLRKKLLFHVNGWNEEEIKLFFIGQLLSLVDFEGKGYSSFAGRSLRAEIDDHELSGIADGMIATGRLEPISPYFCLHEYKPEKGKDVDPIGQVLSAMMVAQHLNADKKPMYGAYILGRLWFFLVLEANRKYAVSLAHDATSEDIFEIFGILAALKKRIEKWVNKGS